MSIRVMSAVWEHEAYSGTDLLVLLALADFANDEGYLWPAIATVARKTRCSERAVQYAMRRLESDGVLTVVGHEKGGRGLSRQYQITLEKGANQSTKGANAAPIDTPERVQNGTERVQNRPKRVQPVAPEPSLEPSIEPSEGSLRASPPPVVTVEADLFRRVRQHLGAPGASLLAKLRRDGVSDERLLTAIDRYERGEIGDLRQYLGGLGKRGPPNSPAVAYLDRILSGDDPRGSQDRRRTDQDDVFGLPGPQACRR